MQKPGAEKLADFHHLEIRVGPQLLIGFHHLNFAISNARIPRPVGWRLLAGYVDYVPINEIKRLLFVVEGLWLLDRVAFEGRRWIQSGRLGRLSSFEKLHHNMNSDTPRLAPRVDQDEHPVKLVDSGVQFGILIVRRRIVIKFGSGWGNTSL